MTATLQDLFPRGCRYGCSRRQCDRAASGGGQQRRPARSQVNIYLSRRGAQRRLARHGHLAPANGAEPEQRGKDQVEYRTVVPAQSALPDFHFYRAEGELQPQRLLGSVVGALQAMLASRRRNRDASRSYRPMPTWTSSLSTSNMSTCRRSCSTWRDVEDLVGLFPDAACRCSIASRGSRRLIEPGAPCTVPVVAQPRPQVKDLRGVSVRRRWRFCR